MQKQALAPRVLAPEREQALALKREPVLVQRQALAPQALAPAQVADVLPRAQVEVLCAGPAVAVGQAESRDGPRLQVRLPVDVLREGPAAVAELPA